MFFRKKVVALHITALRGILTHNRRYYLGKNIESVHRKSNLWFESSWIWNLSKRLLRI